MWSENKSLPNGIKVGLNHHFLLFTYSQTSCILNNVSRITSYSQLYIIRKTILSIYKCNFIYIYIYLLKKQKLGLEMVPLLNILNNI